MVVKVIKFNIVFLSIFICNIQSLSQGFKAGLNVGFVASQVDGDRLDGYNKPAITAGIFSKYLISNKNSFYIAINYIQKGSRKLANPEIPDDRYYILRLNYIEIPIMAIIKIPLESKIKLPYFESGIVFGYLFKAREDVDGTGFIEPIPPFKKYDIPFRIGLNYIVNNHFELKAHYSYSLIPIRPHPGNKTWYFDRGQYNNYLIFSVFYTF
ncbi:MAG: PorT family protein [Bacteroidales bacterium]|nr:PorT family protein [Bacteroidales bacterium]